MLKVPSQTTSLTADGVTSPTADVEKTALPVRLRCWNATILCGMAGGLAAVAIVWLFAPRQYTAVALLQIAASEKQVMFQTHLAESTFDIYKSTQRQLLTSDNVLTAALRNENAAKASVLQQEDDPVRWLARNVHVDFPGNAEIMRVSLTGPEPDDVAILAGAVVDAYMHEVVNKDREEKRERLNELDRLYTEKSTERRRKKTLIKQLADQLKTNQLGTLALKEKMALQAYEEARSELYKIRSELQHAKDELEVKQAWRKALQHLDDSEGGGATDPTISRLIAQIDEIEKRLATLRESAKESNVKDQLAGIIAAQKDIESKLAELRTEFAAKLKKAGRVGLDPEISKLQYTIKILESREKEAAKYLVEQKRLAEQFGDRSIDVEEMQAQLHYLDKILEPLGEQREKLTVELGAAPRITVFQPHTEPGKPIIVESPKSSDPLFVLPSIDPENRLRLLVVLFVLAAAVIPAGLVLSIFRYRQPEA
jgi:polysaccharide biosynthesis transport protein